MARTGLKSQLSCQSDYYQTIFHKFALPEWKIANGLHKYRSKYLSRATYIIGLPVQY
jgi:hypothetical protein